MPDEPAVMDVLTEISEQDSHIAEPELLEDELLVEDVSIDGMCGVY